MFLLSTTMITSRHKIFNLPPMIMILSFSLFLQLVLQCSLLVQAQTTLCMEDFCSDGRNCAHANCQGCTFTCYKSGGGSCSRNVASAANVPSCSKNCSPISCSSMSCQGCRFCGDGSENPVVLAQATTTNIQQCSLGTFQDVTESMLSKDGDAGAYWYQWRHSGKPYNHFTSPVMVDLDGDLMLDYFSSLHGASLIDADEDNNTTNPMELAILKQNDDTIGVVVNDLSSYYLEPLENRIVLEDIAQDGYQYLDNHADVVVDLDNDGILDIYVASGGARGEPINNPQSRDNLVFFGEQMDDSNSSITSSNVGDFNILFKGGRVRAMESNIHMRLGRGRFTYLLDVNGDGLLDIFTSNARRVDNALAPGVLHINEGNRTWRQDDSMSEYSSAMILTDADGDGKAEEFMITRDFCFPDRENPEAHPEFGAFSEDVKAFCSTRPVGTTAVYKFNRVSKRMMEISQTYDNIQADSSYQPECCPHGLSSGRFDCSVISLASADFDNDGKADHVFLYSSKMQFYFSSDRPRGTLPIGNQYIGLTIDLPTSCSSGIGIRLVDLDNSGNLEIIVMCKNIGEVLVYTQGDTKDSWTLDNGCNSNGSLSDLAFSAFEWQIDDIFDACESRDSWQKLGPICDDYVLNGRKEIPIIQGMTLADIDNDGFTDAIVATKLGYLRFFLNRPSATAISNKYISFRLIGDGKEVNRYGIGVTLKLICRDRKKRVIQFREISSYQHSTDHSGSIDEKIIFGLGKNLKPIKVIARWPNRRKQVLNVRRFDFSSPYKIIDIRYPPRTNARKFKKIQLRHQSKSGQNLCLSVGQGREWRLLKFEQCSSSPYQNFWFDKMGRLRNDMHSDYCVTVRYRKKLIQMAKCQKKISKKNSWHLTPDGLFLRASGSNMIIGIDSFSNSTTGEVAALVNLDVSRHEQKVYLRNAK